MNNKQGYMLGILSGMFVLLSNTWAAQPMTESALSTQTGAVTASLPVIIAKAQDDAKTSNRAASSSQRTRDNYLQEVRWNSLRSSVLSPYQEQKQNQVIDIKEKQKLEMIALPDRADRFTRYDFEPKMYVVKLSLP